jgi:hypothetical protein
MLNTCNYHCKLPGNNNKKIDIYRMNELNMHSNTGYRLLKLVPKQNEVENTKCNTGYGLLTWYKYQMRWGKWKMQICNYWPGTKTNEVGKMEHADM